jgi:transcriptional regulator with XRE-family HTH domain
MAKKTISAPRGVGPFDAEIGNRLRAIRLARKLSQDHVAEALGVSFQQVQKYEKGTNRLSVGRLVQFCELFKCGPLEILGWGSKPVGPAVSVETYKLVRGFEALQDDLKGPIRILIMKLIEMAPK